MTKTLLRHAHWLPVLTLLAHAGCGGTNPENDDAAAPDLAIAADLSVATDDLAPSAPADDDGGLAGLDASSDLTPSVPAFDDGGASPLPTGTQLAQGDNLTVLGICNGAGVDAIYIDNTNQSLRAVPIAGGASTPIEKTEWAYLVDVGPFVASYHDGDPTTGKAGLSLWSRAGGLVSLASASYRKGSLAGKVAITGDHRYVVYLDNLSADGSTIDVFVAKTDGTQKTKVTTTPIGAPSTSCAPFYFPASKLPNNTDPSQTNFFVVGTCPPTGDGGALILDVDSVDPASATPALTRIFHDANGFQVNTAGNQLVLMDAASHLQAATSTASSTFGALHELDGTSTVSTLRIAPDGSRVVYLTTGGAILTASTSMTAAPKTLISSGALSILAVSPSFQHLLFNRTKPTSTRATDLYLAPTDAAVTPVTPTTIVATTTSRIYYDGFTADSSHVVYLAGWAGGSKGGTLTSLPVAGGAESTYSSTSLGAFALSGAKMQIADNLRKIGTRTVLDVRMADTASGGPAPYLATAADTSTAYSLDGTKVAYTIGGLSGTLSGLYLSPVP